MEHFILQGIYLWILWIQAGLLRTGFTTKILQATEAQHQLL